MVGIQDLAVYLPAYRVSTADLRAFWAHEGSRGAAPLRACANFDEDALTLAAAAAGRLAPAPAPETLLLASTSLPYAEKQNAALLAAVLGLDGELMAADLTGSPRAAADALRLACDRVAARGGSAVVVAADCRSAWPGSELEPDLGDGAAALRAGPGDGSGLLAAVVDAVTVTAEFTDVWRLSGEAFLRSGDERFSQQMGYQPAMAGAIRRLLERQQLAPDRIRGAALAARGQRAYRSLLAAAGLTTAADLGPQLWQESGDLGAAMPLAMLALSLRRAAPGDLLLLGAYGSGATVFLLEVQDGVRAWAAGGTAAAAPPAQLLPYARRLLYRRAVPTEAVVPFSSLMQTWREQPFNLPLRGRRCQQCGAVDFPVQQVCKACRSQEPFAAVNLARTGTVFTFTVDRLVPSAGGPLAMAVVDLDGGGRLYVQMTDCDPATIQVGTRVELALRRLHEGGGFINYFWKARPMAGDAR